MTRRWWSRLVSPAVDPDPYTRLDRLGGLGEPLPTAEPRRRLSRTWVWPLLVVAGLVWTWLVRPWPVALIATGFALAAFMAAVIVLGRESERLRAWYDDELGRCDDELDVYDRLRALVPDVVRTPMLSAEHQAAVRRLREAWESAEPEPRDLTALVMPEERAS